MPGARRNSDSIRPAEPCGRGGPNYERTIMMELNWIATAVTDSGWETTEGTALFRPDAEEMENQVVNLYPEVIYQTFEGFGGAVTDAAGYVYSLMDEEQKRQVIQTYFAPEQMGYDRVRVHMDSCDFSTELYEAMSDLNDRELDSFSFARTEQYILPMLEDAQRAAGKPLKLMLSPWSPPAFMKTNGSRVGGGSLKPEYRDFWADYICRYIQEFQKRGFEVERISIQNEAHAVQTWDSCIYSAQQEKEFLRDHLHPALVRHGLGGIEVFIWDHNKERLYERVRDTVDDTAKGMVAGAAFHWYSGDHFEALDMVRQQYPDLKLVTSESCIEYRFHAARDEFGNNVKLAHELMGDLNHGINAFYDWNILLDERGGPNHVGNWCYSAFMYDREEALLRTKLLQRFYYHFSHYITPGARRIALSKYTHALEATAFRNPDGTIAVILFNAGKDAIPVNLRLDGQIAELTLEGRIIVSCTLYR